MEVIFVDVLATVLFAEIEAMITHDNPAFLIDWNRHSVLSLDIENTSVIDIGVKGVVQIALNLFLSLIPRKTNSVVPVAAKQVE